MTDFVEQCRGEWRRLGVPDALAEEMATDLACDLREAETEGVSAQELLGNSFSDPRSFAAAWATERGIIPQPPSPAATRRRPLILVAFTALAATALLLAALLLVTGEPKVGIVTSRTAPHLQSPPTGSVLPPGARGQALPTSAAAPIEWILLALAAVALAFALWLWSRWCRSRLAAIA